MWEGRQRGGEGGRQAGKGVQKKEEGSGSMVTCLEYQSTEETKPFQEVWSQGFRQVQTQ